MGLWPHSVGNFLRLPVPSSLSAHTACARLCPRLNPKTPHPLLSPKRVDASSMVVLVLPVSCMSVLILLDIYIYIYPHIISICVALAQRGARHTDLSLNLFFQE